MRNHKTRTGLAGVGLALAAILLLGAVPAAASGEIAGQAGDKKFTMEEVDAKARAANAAVYQQLYDARRQALNSLIENHLLEIEAAARETTVEQLVATEIDAKIAKVTAQDVETWYNENKARVGGRTLDSIRTQIEQEIEVLDRLRPGPDALVLVGAEILHPAVAQPVLEGAFIVIGAGFWHPTLASLAHPLPCCRDAWP